MKKIFFHAPSVVVAVAMIGLIGGFARQYSIGNLSVTKGVFFGVLFLIAAYFALSPFKRKLSYINNIILINVLLILLVTEVAFRALPNKLPHFIVLNLPEPDRGELLAERGYFTGDTLTGEDMLFSWSRRKASISAPWIVLDKNGYRKHPAGKKVDVIFLGDSITMSYSSPRDIVDFIGEKGLTGLSFAVNGYSTLHQRDAYKKFAVDGAIAHRAVVVNFCFCNDVSETLKYERVKKTGGSWRQYLGSMKPTRTFPFDFKPPWVISILFNLPYQAIQLYRDSLLPFRDVTLSTPRGKITLSNRELPDDGRHYSEADWAPTLKGLNDIIAMANGQGARVIIAYYPDLAQIIARHFPASEKAHLSAENDYRDAVSRLKTLAKEGGALFLDYTPPIRAGYDKAMVLKAEYDYHPNELGVEIMSRAVLPVLKQALGE